MLHVAANHKMVLNAVIMSYFLLAGGRLVKGLGPAPNKQLLMTVVRRNLLTNTHLYKSLFECTEVEWETVASHYTKAVESI